MATEIHIVHNLFHNGEELCFKSWNGSKVFMRQGDLDSACAIYSLMMMLIIHGKVKYNDLKRQHKKRPGYTSIKRLQHDLLANLPGLYKEGYAFMQVQAMLNSAFKKIATVSTQSITEPSNNTIKNKKKLQDTIIHLLESGKPVEIGFTYKGGKCGHAVLAIGYQWIADGILRMFCLDPSYEIQETMYWNSIIDMVICDERFDAKYTYSDTSYRDGDNVCIDEILFVNE